MKIRPKTLEYFGVFLILVTLSFPVQIMFLYGHSPLEWQAILSKITILNWIVMSMALLNSYLIFRAEPWVKYTIPAAIAMITLNNWIVGQWEQDYSPLTASLASFGFLASHAVLCQQQILRLFGDPSKRWWLIPRRKKAEVLAYVSPFNGLAFKAKTFDISETGIFIPVHIDELPQVTSFRKPKPKELEVDDRIALCLTLGNLAQIRCDARVVRMKNESQGIYPAGIALTFEGLPRSQRRELRRYLEAAV